MEQIKKFDDRVHADRLLLSAFTAEDAEWWEVRTEMQTLVRFLTGGVNGKDALDTAVGNMLDISEYIPEKLLLARGGLYVDGELWLLGHELAGVALAGAGMPIPREVGGPLLREPLLGTVPDGAAVQSQTHGGLEVTTIQIRRGT